uniref:Uncharacterized protein n=1 Tax=Arundo donax TaxID=35708 RepID=A0A0A9GWJ0_ARUDO
MEPETFELQADDAAGLVASDVEPGSHACPGRQNPVPVPAPVIRNGHETLPAPVACGQNVPAGTPVRPPMWVALRGGVHHQTLCCVVVGIAGRPRAHTHEPCGGAGCARAVEGPAALAPCRAAPEAERARAVKGPRVLAPWRASPALRTGGASGIGIIEGVVEGGRRPVLCGGRCADVVLVPSCGIWERGGRAPADASWRAAQRVGGSGRGAAHVWWGSGRRPVPASRAAGG